MTYSVSDKPSARTKSNTLCSLKQKKNVSVVNIEILQSRNRPSS